MCMNKHSSSVQFDIDWPHWWTALHRDAGVMSDHSIMKAFPVSQMMHVGQFNICKTSEVTGVCVTAAAVRTHHNTSDKSVHTWFLLTPLRVNAISNQWHWEPSEPAGRFQVFLLVSTNFILYFSSCPFFQIMREIQEHKIKIYEFPETDDEEESKLVKKIKVCVHDWWWMILSALTLKLAK